MISSIEVARLYPYLVPESYLKHQSPTDSPTEALGHGIHVVLVVDVGGLVRNVLSSELLDVGLSWADGAGSSPPHRATIR